MYWTIGARDSNFIWFSGMRTSEGNGIRKCLDRMPKSMTIESQLQNHCGPKSHGQEMPPIPEYNVFLIYLRFSSAFV